MLLVTRESLRAKLADRGWWETGWGGLRRQVSVEGGGGRRVGEGPVFQTPEHEPSRRFKANTAQLANPLTAWGTSTHRLALTQVRAGARLV